MIRCNNCGQEVYSFIRVSKGYINDSWCFDDGKYKYNEHEDEHPKSIAFLMCDSCHKKLDKETELEVINKMEKR